MWNWRMLLIDGEARYADIMELNLYNSILSGISLEGNSWFYTNPLRWYGKEHPLISTDSHLIPYYAWANRGISEMTVWIPLA